MLKNTTLNWSFIGDQISIHTCTNKQVQGLLVNTHSNRYSLRQSVTHSSIYNMFIYDEYSIMYE